MNKKTIAGAVLLLVGTLLFVPSVYATTEFLWTLALAPAALMLAAGSYLVGTSEGGRPV